MPSARSPTQGWAVFPERAVRVTDSNLASESLPILCRSPAYAAHFKTYSIR